MVLLFTYFMVPGHNYPKLCGSSLSFLYLLRYVILFTQFLTYISNIWQLHYRFEN